MLSDVVFLILWGLLLATGLIYQLLERYAAPQRTADVRDARFKWGLLATGAYIGFSLLLPPPNPLAWIALVLATAPLLVTALKSCLGRTRAPLLSAFLLFLAGGALLLLAAPLFVFSVYFPLLFILLTTWLYIPLVLILPKAPAYPDEPKLRLRSGLRYLTLPAVAVILVWLALSQWIYFQSTRLAAPAPNCVMSTDGQKSQWALFISVRKMLFEHHDGPVTLPYLRASDANGSFHNHWSFGYMAFVPDETFAFSGGPSYYDRDQPSDPCE